MRFILLAVFIYTGLIAYAQNKEMLDFGQFKVKADSLSRITDTHIHLLYKKDITGMLDDYQFRGQVYLNTATNEIYKASYKEDTGEETGSYRLFYYYKNNLVKMVVSDSAYYPFNGKILNSKGGITNEIFSGNMLRFESNCRKLVLTL
ncbi:MAG: hypothetical protein KF862_11710 [Chitinophagaceae bacterium]|nr:hypothetical protein [Chitinophagaceae bacterium]